MEEFVRIRFKVEGGKHFVPEDHPEEVAAAVNGLLDEIYAH